jgi:transposase
MSENKESVRVVNSESINETRVQARDGVTGPAVGVSDGQAPNPEVKPKVKARRRQLTADYKLKVLREADRMSGDSGAIAALLRREGLYSSHLANWRRLRHSGAFKALSRTRGRKPEHDAKDFEIARLRRENEKLRTWKSQAELIIEAQKKIAQILGNPVQEESLPKLPVGESEMNS